MMRERGDGLTRRRLFGVAAGAAALAAGAGAAQQAIEKVVVNGRIKQGLSRWCLGKVPLEPLCEALAKMGLAGLDLVGPNDWPTLKKYGLTCTMAAGGSLTKGLNRLENHPECLDRLRKDIEAAAQFGMPNVICFSGNRAGLSDDEGLANCVTGLKQVAKLAEEKQVTICMELLNSKRNHKDYQCDRTAWGARMCREVGSERVKLLYDIYHMQVQEGDVIATIKEFKDVIGHYHTAGVPGRHEIDDAQEINYPAVMKAILDTGYTGYVAHEFIPTRDPLTSVAQAARICDV